MSDMTLEPTPSVAELEEHARNIDNQKFAMWLYLASEVIIFTVLIGAYVVFRAYNGDIVHEVHEELGFGGILLVTFNTFLLLTSSWAMVMGLRQIQRDNVKGLTNWLWVTAVLGTIFVFLQYVEYQNLGSKGITLEYLNDSYNGFGMNFYVPTAFHGAHVIIGVLWCLFMIYRANRGIYSAKNYIGIEMFGLYWHFVDVVWILLFTLIYLV